MSDPQNTNVPQQPIMLPGNLMVNPAVAALHAMPVVNPGPVNLADPAMLGAILTGLGMEPIAAAGLIAEVQSDIAQATSAAVHRVAVALYQAQMLRAQVLQQAMLAMPAVDPFGRNRQNMARVIGDPSLPVTPDPTPGILK